MKNNLIVIALSVGIPLIGLLIAWWEVSVWIECRATNSWWYCIRVLGN